MGFIIVSNAELLMAGDITVILSLAKNVILITFFFLIYLSNMSLAAEIKRMYIRRW